MKAYDFNVTNKITFENEVQFVEVVSLPTPTIADKGKELFYNGKKYFCDGSSWVDVSDALTLEGHNSSYFQPASTAINTSNISSQSVSHATSSDNATTAAYLGAGHNEFYFQPASSAITTSNISSQSVNYATSAGSATTANTLTTARSISLTGNVTGSTSFNGGSNVSISTTVSRVSDSLLNQSGNIALFNNDGGGNLGIRFNATGGSTNNLVETGIGYELEIANESAGGDFKISKSQDGNSGDPITWTECWRIEGTTGAIYAANGFVGNLTGNISGNASSANQLTTSHSIILNGDVSGSASFNGTANASITTVVANDSHTHDGRYYTESESDAKYVPFTGGTFTGNITLGSYNISDVNDIYLDDQLLSTGDTDTYFQFHTDNQCRIVTGGTERFEVSTVVLASCDIRATGDVSAYYSDERLKERVGIIDNALESVISLTGFKYKNNELAKSFGYNDENIHVGLSAQELQKVLPEAVVPAPFDIEINEDGTEYSKSGENYLTIKYEKVVPLLVEAIKDLQKVTKNQEQIINELQCSIEELKAK